MFDTVKLVAIGVILSLVFGAYWYVSSLQEDLAIAEENNRKLTLAVEAQQETIKNIRNDIGQIQSVNREMIALANQQQEEIEALSNKFNTSANGEQRDFGEISIAKPGLVEKLINKGTTSALRCLEIASGSPLTESEKKSNELKKECPDIIGRTNN